MDVTKIIDFLKEITIRTLPRTPRGERDKNKLKNVLKNSWAPNCFTGHFLFCSRPTSPRGGRGRVALSFPFKTDDFEPVPGKDPGGSHFIFILALSAAGARYRLRRTVSHTAMLQG